MIEAPTMNPYKIHGPALVSFSGGRTSGYMLKHILDAHGGTLPADVHVAFANTGDEHPATLDFVNECSTRWNVPVTWLEFDPEAPHSTKLVNHNSASRDGAPLDAAIATRPTAHLYNVVSRYCTATTKLRRLQKFMLHWCGHERWTSVLGIRHDEPRRVVSNRSRSGRDRQTIAMPLDDAGVANEDVLRFWSKQPFDLLLPVDQHGATAAGNCQACCLKNRRKLISLFQKDPEPALRMIVREDRMRARIAGLPFTGSGLDARASFFKDASSYRDLLKAAQQSDALDLFAEKEESVDCACTD